MVTNTAGTLTGFVSGVVIALFWANSEGDVPQINKQTRVKQYLIDLGLLFLVTEVKGREAG